MTLTRTLQIEEKWLQLEDLRALDYCERRWQQEERPATKWGMVNFLERMLQELKQNGIGYPKVLLLRKKEIQRRQFTVIEPYDQAEAAVSDAKCSCIGGWLLSAGGSGTPCPCEKGDPHRKQLAKWGMKF